MESGTQYHGIREFHRNESEEDLYVEEIRNIGYAIIDGGLSPEELQLVREKIDAVYEQQVREIGGQDRLERINDANVARCLIGYDEYFINLAVHPKIISIATKLLGEYFILMSQNGIINRPTETHYQVTWHRDLNYQHFVASRPLALSALYCIDEFTEETGGTYLIPASHKIEAFPSEDYVARQQKIINAKAGSILIFNAMVFHRSGLNRSGKVRRAVNHIFTLPLIKQQISFPKILQGKFSDDGFLRRFLGYETESSENVQQWRMNKLKIVDAGSYH